MSDSATQKVIARFRDGVLVKGTTRGFKPHRARFRLRDENGRNHRVDVRKLKAVFFVKDFGGNPLYRERKGFFLDSDLTHKVLVEFHDGEVLCGYTKTYSPGGQGFFLVPGDPNSNNVRVFVVRTSIRKVKVKEITQAQEERQSEELPPRTPADA